MSYICGLVGLNDLNVTRINRWICIPVRIREWRGIYSVTRDRDRVSWMRNWVIHNELEDLIHNLFSNSPRERSKSISDLHGRAWTKNKASINNSLIYPLQAVLTFALQNYLCYVPTSTHFHLVTNQTGHYCIISLTITISTSKSRIGYRNNTSGKWMVDI